jgi:putative nucleotidyltransferase with HDIG domain
MIEISAQTIFDKITNHLLTDEKPSEFMEELSERKEFQNFPFSLILALETAEQSPKYHAEGNAWNHTMLVIDEAARVRIESKDPLVFMWSALLHDIGKPETTRVKKGRITSYDHDKAGERLSREFLEYFSMEEKFIQSVSAMVRYHMHMLYILRKLPYSDLMGLLRKVDVDELALLCLCDRLGRKGADIAAERKEYGEFLKLLHYSLEKSMDKIV